MLGIKTILHTFQVSLESELSRVKNNTERDSESLIGLREDLNQRIENIRAEVRGRIDSKYLKNEESLLKKRRSDLLRQRRGRVFPTYRKKRIEDMKSRLVSIEKESKKEVRQIN
jgi:hypothetical protein